MKSLLLSIFVIVSFSLLGQSQRIDSLKLAISSFSDSNKYAKQYQALSELNQEYISLNDTDEIVGSLIKMAEVSRGGGSLLEGLNVLEDILKSGYAISSYNQIEQCLVKGSILYEVKDHKGAIKCGKQAINVGVEIGDSSQFGMIYNLLGASYINENVDSAIYFLEQSINFYLSRSQASGLPLPYINISRLYSERGDSAQAFDIIYKTLEILDDKDIPIYRVMAYGHLSHLYIGIGDFRNGLKYVRLRDSVNYEINSNEITFHINQLQDRLKNEKETLDLLKLKGKVDRAEYENNWKNGLIVAGLLLIVLLGLFLFISIKNLKSRKASNKLISKKAKELEELNKFKNKVISVISHDMRSPLAQIITLHQAKNSGIVFSEVELKDMERAILASTKSGLLILDNLLKWANSQLDGLALRADSFNSNMLLAHILNQVNQIAKEKNIELVTSLEELDIVADEGLFEIVMRNILSNAIKYSPENRSVWITSKVSADKFEVTVIDEGPGIEELVIKQLENGDNVKSKNGSLGEKGAGIGLSFSMEFAKKMGGKLVCSRLPERGTKVVFCIPLKKVD